MPSFRQSFAYAKCLTDFPASCTTQANARKFTPKSLKKLHFQAFVVTVRLSPPVTDLRHTYNIECFIVERQRPLRLQLSLSSCPSFCSLESSIVQSTKLPSTLNSILYVLLHLYLNNNKLVCLEI
jgi:hypothetical protein